MQKNQAKFKKSTNSFKTYNLGVCEKVQQYIQLKIAVEIQNCGFIIKNKTNFTEN